MQVPAGKGGAFRVTEGVCGLSEQMPKDVSVKTLINHGRRGSRALHDQELKPKKTKPGTKSGFVPLNREAQICCSGQ